MRIVSFIASATEIVCALGFEHALVGRSHECDFPLSILNLPQCTETSFDTSGTSRDIDERVKALSESHEPVYRVRIELLKSIKPDIIITQSQCMVCAVSEADARRAIAAFDDPTPTLVTLETNGLDDLWTDIQKVADALHVTPRGHALVASLQQKMSAIETTTKTQKPIRVAYIEWIDPLMAGGNWMPELIARAGGVSCFGIAGKHSPWLSFDALIEADPDLILIAPCGFDLTRTEAELSPLVSHPEWNALRAVQTNRVVIADGNHYFNRPGPRLLTTLEILAEIFNPDCFSFGHEHNAWRRIV